MCHVTDSPKDGTVYRADTFVKPYHRIYAASNKSKHSYRYNIGPIIPIPRAHKKQTPKPEPIPGKRFHCSTKRVRKMRALRARRDKKVKALKTERLDNEEWSEKTFHCQTVYSSLLLGTTEGGSDVCYYYYSHESTSGLQIRGR